MPLTRDQKEGLVASYQEGVAKAPHAFLLSCEGVTVPEVTEFRHRVRETGGEYVVVKNRLLLRAIEGAALDGLREEFSGATAVAYASEDAVALAKTVAEFAKSVPAVTLKKGLLDGQTVEASDIEEIASLPSREELIAKLLFLLQSPVTSFVRTLNELPRQFVSVLGEVAITKES